MLSAAAAAKFLQSCPILCDPIDGSPPESSLPGILQARIWEWAAISFSNSCMHAKSLQSYPTLFGPLDSSPPGSSVHRILQARILEWVAISLFYLVKIIIIIIIIQCCSEKCLQVKDSLYLWKGTKKNNNKPNCLFLAESIFDGQLALKLRGRSSR